VLVGDSVACSLLGAVEVVGGAAGWKVNQGAVVGCGIVSGEVVSGTVRVPPSSFQCPFLVSGALDQSFKQHRPQVALWVSSWERADLKVGDQTLKAGSKAWERTLQKRMDATLRQITRRGTHVVVATQASLVDGIFGHMTDAEHAVQDAAFGRMNLQLVRFAARHPKSVTLVDLAGKVCPGGPPCPQKVDGLLPRALDGGHFTPEGAVWVLRWLVPYIELAGGKKSAGT
jgi:hypothetical protein